MTAKPKSEEAGEGEDGEDANGDAAADGAGEAGADGDDETEKVRSRRTSLACRSVGVGDVVLVVLL